MVWVGLALAEWELPRPVVGADAAPSVVDWDARARETVVGEGEWKGLLEEVECGADRGLLDRP